MKRLFTICLVLLLCASAFATPIGIVRDTVGAFTGPRAGTDPDDNIKALLDQMNAEAKAGNRYADGKIFFVDAGVGTSGDGSTWAKAYKTVTEAITASSANIAVSGNSYKRNTIYVGGVGYSEDFVLMPKYTDIVGVGNPRPYINGTWTIPNAAANGGCRFYNLVFIDDTGSGSIFTITGQAGIEWHDCWIAYTTTEDYGITLTQCRPFLIENCLIGPYATSSGDWGYSLAAIKIVDGTNTLYDCVIKNCVISSKITAIDWDETSSSNCRIHDNEIYSGRCTIDEESDHVRVYNNTLYTNVSMEDAYDFNISRASNNMLTCAEGQYAVPALANDSGHFERLESRGADGMVYYVNSLVTTAGDGLSWATAFKTIDAALDASQANMALTAPADQRAKRNTIYVTGYSYDEDLNNLARRTDIVGVGSKDAGKRPIILGNMAIADTNEHMGCRFYNMRFDPQASGVLLDIDTQSGLEFHNCWFQGSQPVGATIGVLFEECQDFVIDNCTFYATFSTADVHVVDDTDWLYTCKINNNRFLGSAAKGIFWEEDNSYECFITDNYIHSVGMPIDDDGNACFVINNIMITELAKGANTAFDFNEALAAGNIVRSSNDCNNIPDIR